MTAHSTMACNPGSVLTSSTLQHYRLLNLLGRGGVGEVFEALHIDSGRRVAIKLLHPLAATIASDCNMPSTHLMRRACLVQNHRQQFARELRLCAQVKHPNIVPLLDQGLAGNDRCFAVFALLPGQTLKELLIQKGVLTPLETGVVMRQVLAALVGLHTQGIAHRDLKPQNIMVNCISTNTQVTLFDFGIAAMLPEWINAHEPHQPPDMNLSLTNACLCSPAYSAPEQLRGTVPSTKADLYAWGLLLLECLTGQATMYGHNVAEICQKQLCSDEVQIPPGLQSHPLATLLRRVLHKEPLRREANAEVLYRDLLQIDWLDIATDLRVIRPGRLNVDCGGLTQSCEWDGVQNGMLG